jgi:hypothetical protein
VGRFNVDKEKVAAAYLAVEKFVPRPFKGRFRIVVLFILNVAVTIVSWSISEIVVPMIDFLRWVAFRLGL